MCLTFEIKSSKKYSWTTSEADDDDDDDDDDEADETAPAKINIDLIK